MTGQPISRPGRLAGVALPLLVLICWAWGGASPALAQAKLSGDASFSFGRVSGNTFDPAEWLGGFESNLWVSGGKDPLTGQVQLRLRGANDGTTSNPLDAIRASGFWQAGEGMTVVFAGRSPGQGGSARTNADVTLVHHDFGGNRVSDNPNGNIGDVGVYDASGLGLTLAMGSMTAEVHMFHGCRPQCNTAGAAVLAGESTIYLGVNGKQGTLQYNAGYQSATAMSNGPGWANEGTGSNAIQLGFSMQGDGFSLGLDFAKATLDAGDPTVGTETVVDQLKLGVIVAGIGVSYYRTEANTGGAISNELTEIDVSYGIKKGGGTLAIELRDISQPNVVDTALLFGMKLPF